MRWGSRARSKTLLTVAACRDVVERVRSMCILLSLIWAARHPLHLSFFCVFLLKRKILKLKIAVFTFLSLTLWLFSNCFFFSRFICFICSSKHIFHDRKSLFLLFLCFCWDEHPTTTIFTPTTPWPVELCDSLVKVLGEYWDDSHKSKCNQVCLFAHVDEVVPSGCWRVAASWLFFSLFVLHAWCSGSVRVDCCA